MASSTPEYLTGVIMHMVALLAKEKLLSLMEMYMKGLGVVKAH